MVIGEIVRRERALGLQRVIHPPRTGSLGRSHCVQRPAGEMWNRLVATVSLIAFAAVVKLGFVLSTHENGRKYRDRTGAETRTAL